MKNWSTVLLLSAIIAVSACKKASGPPNVKSAQVNNTLDSSVYMSAMINGFLWVTDSAFGYQVKSSANDSGASSLMVTATRIKGDSISTITFQISQYTGDGTYAIDPPYTSLSYYVGNTRYFATNGEIVINPNKINSLVATGNGGDLSLSGTFSFVADSLEVWGGNFYIARP